MCPGPFHGLVLVRGDEESPAETAGDSQVKRRPVACALKRVLYLVVVGVDVLVDVLAMLFLLGGCV